MKQGRKELLGKKGKKIIKLLLYLARPGKRKRRGKKGKKKSPFLSLLPPLMFPE